MKLFNADCMDILPTLEDQSVGMALCDPPYRMTKTGNSCRPNYMPYGEILDGNIPDTKAWMKEVYRVLEDSSHFYTFCNRNTLLEYLTVAKSCGFHYHNSIVMIKDTNMPNRWYLKFTEHLLMFKKGKAKAITDMTSRDYEHVVMPKGPSKNHPTEKPLGFMEKIVRNSSERGAVVLDVFMGSGTTGVACANTGRDFIGIEKHEGYFKTASDRIHDAEVKALL